MATKIKGDSAAIRDYWEAEDTDDDLDAEIQKKIDKKYPMTNTIFEECQADIRSNAIEAIAQHVMVLMPPERASKTALSHVVLQIAYLFIQQI